MPKSKKTKTRMARKESHYGVELIFSAFSALSAVSDIGFEKEIEK
jgi:hypothetical protein